MGSVSKANTTEGVTMNNHRLTTSAEILEASGYTWHRDRFLFEDKGRTTTIRVRDDSAALFHVEVSANGERTTLEFGPEATAERIAVTIIAVARINAHAA